MGFVKNIKGMFSEHFQSDYDDYDSAINDDDYEDAERDEEDAHSSIYENDNDGSAADDYSYSPQSAINVPEYNFGTPVKEKKPVHKESVKQSANIYNMSSARPINKFKLNSILLRDIYDAKNVAALMMEKDTIVVVNLSLLTEEQKVRAMDFLDGAKFVTKSVFARFAENICAFVPETVELFGDFFSQIDMESFK